MTLCKSRLRRSSTRLSDVLFERSMLPVAVSGSYRWNAGPAGINVLCNVSSSIFFHPVFCTSILHPAEVQPWKLARSHRSCRQFLGCLITDNDNAYRVTEVDKNTNCILPFDVNGQRFYCLWKWPATRFFVLLSSFFIYADASHVSINK